MDHKRHAQPTTWKGNRPRVRQTRLQRSWHECECTLVGWGNSDGGRFTSVCLKNSAISRIPSRSQRTNAQGNWKKKFCFALRLCIYRILVALQITINLNHFAASERTIF